MNPEELYKKHNNKFKNDSGELKTHRKSVEKENGELLYYLVKILKPETIIETGSGFSTIMMANALMENGKGTIWSFDIDKNWHDYSEATLETAPDPITGETKRRTFIFNSNVVQEVSLVGEK